MQQLRSSQPRTDRGDVGCLETIVRELDQQARLPHACWKQNGDPVKRCMRLDINHSLTTVSDDNVLKQEVITSSHSPRQFRDKQQIDGRTAPVRASVIR